MENFEYYTPTRVVFGRGTEQKTGSLIREQGGRKVLIHYGSPRVEQSGLLAEIEDSLREAGLSFVTLGGVVPNPRISKVREGIALCRKENVDFLLAVGGGSVIDSAKAIGYGLVEGDDFWELFERRRTAKGCAPVGVVLTIAASGSEMSNSCVITNEDGWLKRSYNDDCARPRFAILNPELTLSLPDYQTESGCVDICMHTMERYFNPYENLEMTDGISVALLRTVMKNAQILHRDPDNYKARAEVMWAGSLSHNGLTGCGVGGGDFASHGIEHELSALFDVTHGAGLAAIWASWARSVYRSCPGRFVSFARDVFGIDRGEDDATARAGIDAMEDFFRSVGMPTSLTELGVNPTEEQIDEMAEKCCFHGRRTVGGVKKLTAKDVAAIYRLAR